ncbi:MAG: zf-HC2 domain-containing protein [Terracidiphilus sp.]
MAERTHIPSSPACGEWETLLADALDGLLSPENEAKFTAHKAVCPACTELYEEARKGREWLEFLSPAPEPPAGLLEKILASTGPGHRAQAGWAVGGALPVPAGSAAIPAFVPPVWQQPGFAARFRANVQPSLLMTAAMAFFSIALTLNLAGVRLSSLRLADLRPRAVRSLIERQLTMASVPIVRYYDNLRFVYEVESRVRELRGEAESGGNGEQQRDDAQPVAPGETRQSPGQNPGHHDGGSRVDPQEEPGNPATGSASGPPDNFVETSLTFQNQSTTSRTAAFQAARPRGPRPVHSGGSAMRARERSRVWIA